MSDDETFIRAIVDAPGDDLPRLVYADWLDDRDDPRGPYLRAEREVVETGDVARLRELAAGLDPVWVARISRPPVGVCCDRIPLSKSGPRLYPNDLRAFEEKHGLRIPYQYAGFLLNHNGGSFWPYEFPAPPTEAGRRLPVNVNEISPLDHNKVLSFPRDGLGPLLVIRDDEYTTYLLLGLAPRVEGQVYLHDMYYNYEYFGSHGPLCLATSLSTFIDQLQRRCGTALTLHYPKAP